MNTAFWSSPGVTGILLKVAYAIIIVIATWVIAGIVRWVVKRLVSRIGFLKKTGGDGRPLAETLGRVIGLLIWLFGLIALLQLFGLTQVVAPLQNLLGGVFAFLPRLLGAAFVFFIGYVVATILRQLIVAALGAIDFSKLAGRLSQAAQNAQRKAGAHAHPDAAADADTIGIGAMPKPSGIPAAVGSVVFGIVLFLVAITALQVLGLDAVSVPAQGLLHAILNALPAIIGAGVVMAIGVAIAIFIARLLRGILPAGGLEHLAREVGIDATGAGLSAGIAMIVQIAIIVFFGIAATQLLGLPQITAVLNTLLALAGHILLGAAIIAAGFLIAGMLGRIVTSTVPGRIVRYTTITLFAAMGLENMGLADSIVNLAFGAIVIGAALAAALAFGFGGRAAAARVLDRLDAKVADSKQKPQQPEPPIF